MICEIIIQVADVDAAVDFYERTCRFTYVRAVEHDGAKVVEMDAGGQRVTLVPSATPGVRLALRSDDVRDDQPAVQEHARDIVGPVEIEGGAWLGFTDPWGNQLGFWEPRDEDA